MKRAVRSGVPIEIASDSYGLYQHSRILNALVYDLGETRDVTSVLASGNNSSSIDNHSELTNTVTDSPYAVVVAASNANGQLASCSNYSSALADVVAPGAGILPTIPVSQSEYCVEVDEHALCCSCKER